MHSFLKERYKTVTSKEIAVILHFHVNNFMKKKVIMKCVLYFFSLLILVATRMEAAPSKVAGVNIGGLHADLKTNLFDPNGPLAQLGKEIASGASQLESELTRGAEALEKDLQKTKNFLSQGSQEEIAGVNIAGLHAGIKTNLFSSSGPLAQIEADLAAGEKQLQKDLTKGADVLKASLTGAADAFKAELDSGANLLTSGLQSLGQQVSWPTAGASLGLDDLFKGSNNLFSANNIETNSNEGRAVKLNPLELTETISGNIPNMKPQKISKTTTILVSGQPGQESEQTLTGKASGSSNALLNIQGGISGQTAGASGSSNALLNILEGGNSGQTAGASGSSNAFLNILQGGNSGLTAGATGSSNALLSILQGGNSGQTAGKNSITKTISVNGQVSGSNPSVDLSSLFQNMQLPNMCGNPKGE